MIKLGDSALVYYIEGNAIDTTNLDDGDWKLNANITGLERSKGDNSASGSYAIAMGYQDTASGSYSTAMGKNTTASGQNSMAIGEAIEAKGKYSIAIALDNLNDSVLLDNNTMAIMGGEVGIGTLSPTQKLDVRGSVRIDEFIYDENNDTGNVGQVLVRTATGMDWKDRGTRVEYFEHTDTTERLTTSPTYVDVGHEITFTLTDTSDIKIETIVNRVQNDNNIKPTIFRLTDGIRTTSEFSIGRSNGWNQQQVMLMDVFKTLPAGTYTFKLQWKTTGGNAKILHNPNRPGTQKTIVTAITYL